MATKEQMQATIREYEARLDKVGDTMLRRFIDWEHSTAVVVVVLVVVVVAVVWATVK